LYAIDIRTHFLNKGAISMDITALIVSAISGLVGGNLTGAALKDKSIGAIGNSIAGIIGGVAGTYILEAVHLLQMMGLAELSVGAIAGMIGSGAIGGAILTGIVGFIKNTVMKK
jgi:uncharacterized membrane protein YeaQ/YmgE (transglycosylase-associated protein family)